MFNFMCNRLIIHNGNRAIRSSQTQGLYVFPIPQTLLFPRINFFSTDVEHDSFAVSYLMNTFDFSRKNAMSISKYLNLKTAERPDSVLALFESNGVEKTQVKKLVQAAPTVLHSDPVKTHLPKIHFFQSIGISGDDLGALIASYYTPFRCSLENQIIPCFNYICNLLKSREATIHAIKRHPVILSRNVKTEVEPCGNILRDNGVSVSNIILFLRLSPYFRTINLDKFKEDIERVREMGINPSRSQFIVAIIGMRPMDKIKWRKKVDLYKKWGFTEEQIVASFVKLPWFMVASEDKINAAMDFFVNKMEWEPSVIAKKPKLVTLSLKKRIVPRAAVFHYLNSKGVLKKEHSNFATYIMYTEKLFLERFVDSYDEAPELLKLYKEKLSASS